MEGFASEKSQELWNGLCRESENRLQGILEKNYIYHMLHR